MCIVFFQSPCIRTTCLFSRFSSLLAGVGSFLFIRGAALLGSAFVVVCWFFLGSRLSGFLRGSFGEGLVFEAFDSIFTLVFEEVMPVELANNIWPVVSESFKCSE